MTAAVDDCPVDDAVDLVEAVPEDGDPGRDRDCRDRHRRNAASLVGGFADVPEQRPVRSRSATPRRPAAACHPLELLALEPPRAVGTGGRARSAEANMPPNMTTNAMLLETSSASRERPFGLHTGSAATRNPRARRREHLPRVGRARRASRIQSTGRHRSRQEPPVREQEKQQRSGQDQRGEEEPRLHPGHRFAGGKRAGLRQQRVPRRIRSRRRRPRTGFRRR